MTGVKKTAGKKKTTTRTLRTPIRRVCKDLGIKTVNKDAMPIVQGSFEAILNGVIEHTVKMLENDKHRLTHKTANLAFIGYMESLGAPDDICQEALERADTAKQSLLGDA